MKIISIILLASGVFFLKTTESPLKKNYSCDIFKQNNKAQDTLVIRATYIDWVELPHTVKPLLYLEQKGILKARDFKSDIIVKVPNCETEYHLVRGDHSKEADKILTGDLQVELLLTCVVFRDDRILQYNKKPFVIVTKVRKAR